MKLISNRVLEGEAFGTSGLCLPDLLTSRKRPAVSGMKVGGISCHDLYNFDESLIQIMGVFIKLW